MFLFYADILAAVPAQDEIGATRENSVGVHGLYLGAADFRGAQGEFT